jgi:hypothetical protein
VLCKHEVVGSIPSGSTSLRWLRQLRIGKPDRKRRLPRRSSKSEDGLPVEPTKVIVRETSLRTLRPAGCACGISDIVKRRSIRVWDLRSNSRNFNHYLQIISALVHRKMSGL